MKKVKTHIIHVLHLIQRALINGVFQLMIIIAFLVQRLLMFNEMVLQVLIIIIIIEDGLDRGIK